MNVTLPEDQHNSSPCPGSIIAAVRTYAERLGWPRGSRVVILHIDDAGMSHESNDGVKEALNNGVANSTSVMIPCGWSSEFLMYLKENPAIDVGVHLTLTSEWDTYRWRPLQSKDKTPGIFDQEGCFWQTVQQVLDNATAAEVEKEIRAQLEQALNMGIKPTHIDSHMFTLFGNRSFLEAYLKLGIEKQIPVMFPGGENAFYDSELKSNAALAIKNGHKPEKDPIRRCLETGDSLKGIGEMLWANGLPVLDDLHNSTYGWEMFDGDAKTDLEIQTWYTDKYIESISKLSPGLTMVIMHCTKISPGFKNISNSGVKRKGDLLAMVDPRLKTFLENNNIILTTWREVMDRRIKVRNNEF